MSFSELRTRLLGVAFVLGPLLTLIAGLIYVADFDRNPGMMAWGSPLEGFVGFFGFILLTPVFLALANQLGYSMPKLGAISLVTALIGFAGGGVMNMVLRVIIPDLVEAGVTPEMFDKLAEVYISRVTLQTILVFTGPLGPLTSVLVGIGYLRSRQHVATGALLLSAGLAFVIGQGAQVLPDIFYTGAVLLWAIALVPLGMKLLRGGSLGARSET